MKRSDSDVGAEGGDVGMEDERATSSGDFSVGDDFCRLPALPHSLKFAEPVPLLDWSPELFALLKTISS